MPDLTTRLSFICLDEEHWQTVVEGSKGAKYTVTYDSINHLNRKFVQLDYSCSCQSYKFGGGKYCKHIKKVIEDKQRCTWNSDEEPMTHDHKCPRCGNDIVPYREAV